MIYKWSIKCAFGITAFPVILPTRELKLEFICHREHSGIGNKVLKLYNAQFSFAYCCFKLEISEKFKCLLCEYLNSCFGIKILLRSIYKVLNLTSG